MPFMRFLYNLVAGISVGVLILAAMPASAASEIELTLVREGKPLAEIVIASNATQSARLAAAEIQYHIRKISGAQTPIVFNAGSNAATRILVGESASIRALGLRPDKFGEQEYLIRFLPSTVVLIGRDSDKRDGFDYETGEGFPALVDDEQGTLYATYDFLERFCDVRWYLPTELGLTFKPRSTLTVRGTEVRRAPWMKYRYTEPGYRYPADLCGDTVKGAAPLRPLSMRETMLWYLRNRIGGRPYAVNHSFYGYYDRFLKTHPDWFAQGYAGRALPPQLCYSNTQLIQQVVQDARDYFDGRGLKPSAVGKGNVFALVPMDNQNWCQCPACQAILSQTNGASEYIFGFVNKVARQVQATHPGKTLSVLAYEAYEAPPVKETLASNVTVEVCAGTRGRWEPNANFTAWASVGRPLYLWDWYCFPILSASQGGYRVFPPFFAHEVVKQMAVYRKSGLVGMKYEPSYLYGSQQGILFDQLEFHVTWRLADNPDLDGNRLIDEYFTRYYGPAAEPMRKFYTRAEQIFLDGPGSNCPPQISVSERQWKYLGTAERMKELESYIEAAKRLAVTDPEKSRVALFEKGIWQYMLKGRETYLDQAKIPIQSASVPRVAPPAAGDPRRLDWSRAAALRNWKALNGMPRSDNRAERMEGWAVHDGVNFYLKLEDRTPPADLKVRLGIWDSDEYELFMSDTCESPFHQVGIMTTGAFEVYLDDRKALQKVDIGLAAISDTAASDRWTLYVTLPLAKLTPQGVKPGGTFFMNLVRSFHCNDAVAWNPTFGGYRDTARLGAVTLE